MLTSPSSSYTLSFRRNAVFLFVNGGGNDYKNMFFGHSTIGLVNNCADKASLKDKVVTKYAVAKSEVDIKLEEGGKKAVTIKREKGTAKGLDEPRAAEGRDNLSVSWFAQSRQHEETPVIQRLIHCNDDPETEVILFCRCPGEDYVCCGSLEYVAHDPYQRPMEFEWRLRDAQKMLSSKVFLDVILHNGN